jgi:predicted component of type VI protein secretion system
MNKIITATLSFVAAFALVAGVAGISSAQAVENISSASINGTSWSKDTSNVLNIGSSGKNRKVNVTVTNLTTVEEGRYYNFSPAELTGSGSFDDYFDCNGNEVYSMISACDYVIHPGETKTLTLKVGDSSFWKDRDGVYLFDQISGQGIDGNVSYTMTYDN